MTSTPGWIAPGRHDRFQWYAMRGGRFVEVDDERRTGCDYRDERGDVEDVAHLANRSQLAHDRDGPGRNSDLFVKFAQTGAGEIAVVLVVHRAAGESDLPRVAAEVARPFDEDDLVRGVRKDGYDDCGQAPRRLCAFGHFLKVRLAALGFLTYTSPICPSQGAP